MKILVTGAFGYLGSSLVLQLLKKNHHVVAYDKMYFGCPSVFLNKFKNLEIVNGDIGDQKLISKYIQKCERLIHLAGIVGEEACNANKVLAKKTNFSDVIKMLKICERKKLKHLIYVSTCSNYGIQEKQNFLKEENLLKPISSYSKQKVKIEEFVINKYNKNYTILRLGTLCGLSPRTAIFGLILKYLE